MNVYWLLYSDLRLSVSNRNSTTLFFRISPLSLSGIIYLAQTFSLINYFTLSTVLLLSLSLIIPLSLSLSLSLIHFFDYSKTLSIQNFALALCIFFYFYLFFIVNQFPRLFHPFDAYLSTSPAWQLQISVCACVRENFVINRPIYIYIYIYIYMCVCVCVCVFWMYSGPAGWKSIWKVRVKFPTIGWGTTWNEGIQIMNLS